MQKTVGLNHNKSTDLLKLGSTLPIPKLANICLHSSTSAKKYSLTKSDKDLLSIISEDMVGGPSIVFTRKAVVDDTHIRKSMNVCRSIFGIDARQLLPLLKVSTYLFKTLHKISF